MRLIIAFVASLVISLIALPAYATITVLHSWQLGEADTGAVSGGTAAVATTDSVGGFNLNKVGAPSYAADVPARIGSSLSMAFDGAADEYMNTTGVASTLTDNFGIEAWVKSNGSTTGNAAIAYNGNSSTSGWGIYRLGSDYGFLYGGNLASPASPISTAWTHLAMVRSNGATTFYVNGAAAGASTPIGPNVPAGGVGIGGNPLVNSFELFDGKIDEVRIFSFAPGAFSVNDLNLPAVVPTPTLAPRELMLLCLIIGMLGVLAVGRMRRV